MLVTTYQTYHSYKLEKGLYPINYKLRLKLEEAKVIKQELSEMITQIELNKNGGEKC